ncbi:rhomboid family intramembrane serine protease [Roseovarius gahaiensis]|uniref:Rhomboid family intramembrane serine protease n=1 Tax=Roseovarius gahaiensis TaxID=2716691 RepID=A0A967EFI8_9RHOB|nr:rhomboid family intramembrane serine protease [Roseovarius gahaiensis]NHQ73550.1 rhomboid family intramembrane serine protease [Roseovarius gahaiensis]
MNTSQPDDRPDGPLAPQSGAPAFLWVLVGVMAALEGAFALAGAGVIGSPDMRWAAFRLGAFWQPIFSGEVPPLYPGQPVAMFLTYAFLHGGLMHLAFNGVVLLSLGKAVAARIGAARTLFLLALAAVAGGAGFGMLSSGTAPMVGASGAVFGLIGLWQCWDYTLRRWSGAPVRPVLGAIAGLAVANVVLFVFLSGGLAWEAHLGGWLAGWVSGYGYARSRRGTPAP